MKILSVIIVVFLFGEVVNAQSNNGIGIGTTEVDPSAILEIESNNKGLLAPRVTSRSLIAVTTASKGVIVYDTTDDGYYYYDGSSWLRLVTTPQNITLDMGSNKVVNLASGSASTDAVNKGQMDAADNLKLSKSGGSMSGNLSMGMNQIRNVGDATLDNDVVNKKQLNVLTTDVSNLKDQLGSSTAVSISVSNYCGYDHSVTSSSVQKTEVGNMVFIRGSVTFATGSSTDCVAVAMAGVPALNTYADSDYSFCQISFYANSKNNRLAGSVQGTRSGTQNLLVFRLVDYSNQMDARTWTAKFQISYFKD